MPNSRVMSLIEKLETLVNNLLILLGQLITRALIKIIPSKVRLVFSKPYHYISLFIIWCKQAPKQLMRNLPVWLAKVKSQIFTFNIKEKLKVTFKSAISQYESQQKGLKLTQFKKLFLTPFLMMGQWLNGLNTAQTVMLLGFTSASVLAGINMVFSGNRMMASHMNETRAPASIEEEITYDRPNYYKKQNRRLDIVNLRLPVYIPKVNELRSVDIDFSATLTNRLSRMKLERLEFQLRDHLILNVEPMVTSFPLEEEGKAILRKKITAEMNTFMLEHKIEGEVKDVKVIYILAN
jgi:flagellar basal body-associated protein FliL